MMQPDCWRLNSRWRWWSTGKSPTLGSGSLRLLYLTLAGIASGLILACIVEWFEHRIDDGPIEIAISILVPYAAYLGAEAIHASGVLAVVAAGLYLGHKSSRIPFSWRTASRRKPFGTRSLSY